MTSRTVSIDTPLGLAAVEIHRPRGAPTSVLLTHGASGSITAADINAVRVGLTDAGYAVAMVHQAWAVAGRRMPPRPGPQDAAWLPIVAALTSGRSRLPGPIVLAGKSNGARVACRTAVDAEADAVLCLSFPLHPPANSERSRAEELLLPIRADIPLRVIQGERDPFGAPAEIAEVLGGWDQLTAVPGAHTVTRTEPLVQAAVAFVDSVAARA